jgi:hypothetical protein
MPIAVKIIFVVNFIRLQILKFNPYVPIWLFAAMQIMDIVECDFSRLGKYFYFRFVDTQLKTLKNYILLGTTVKQQPNAYSIF